ncbi:MAG: aminodeoxychorismate lyase [Lachnospiraceae bacterium]|nr:aminodeoxychorismate lyase [Lachnospiraceae bacterium]
MSKKKNSEMKKDSLLGTAFSTIIHVLLIVAALYLIYHYAQICYEYGYRAFKEPPMSSGEGKIVSVTIPSDISAKSMAKLLEAKGLSRDWKVAFLQYYCSEYRKEIKAGTYKLSTAMTVEEMFAVMAGVTDEAEEVPDELLDIQAQPQDEQAEDQSE